MREPQAEATEIARTLRSRAADLPPQRRLKVPGAAREVLGLHKGDLLELVASWLKTNEGFGDEELFGTACALWNGKTREEQFVASRMLARRPDILEPVPWTGVHSWLDGIDSIEGADAAAIYLVAPWTAFDLTARLPALRSLLVPGNLVGRRVALVATAAMRSKEGYPGITLEFVKRTVDDREPLVVDAIVWALCALARHHRPLVEAFLEETDRLDQLAREQVENWLQTGSRKGLVDREWRFPQR